MKSENTKKKKKIHLSSKKNLIIHCTLVSSHKKHIIKLVSWAGLHGNLYLSPQIRMSKPQLPVPQNVTVFRERALEEVIKLKGGRACGPNPTCPVSLGEAMWTHRGKTICGGAHRHLRAKERGLKESIPLAP